MICQTCQNKKQVSSIILTNNCEFHRQQYQSVSLRLSDKTNTYKACKKCEEERFQDKFFNFNEIKQKLNTSASADRINQIVQISQQIIQQTENDKRRLICLAEEIQGIVMNGIYQMFSFQIPGQVGQQSPFSDQEIFHLLTPSTIKTFDDLKNRQISIQNADDMSSMLITKILFMDQCRDFIKQLEKNSPEIQKHIKQITEGLSQTKVKIKQQMQIQPQEKEKQIQKEKEKEKGKQNQDNKQIMNGQIQSIILQLQGERKQISNEYSENSQVKAIMSIDKDQLAYAKRECICILNKKNNLKKIETIQFKEQEEDFLQFACSFEDMGEKYIAAGIEQQDSQGKIVMWKLKQQKWEFWKQIIGDKPIKKILYSHENHIITSSEDKKIEMINFNKEEKKLIYQEEKDINDIVLIKPSTLIYITSTKIKALDFKNKKILDSNEIENCLCIEIMNSETFVVGKTGGQVEIFSFNDKDKFEIKFQMDLHSNDVRYISRIDQMHFVTSSYDGKHSFVTLNGEKFKTIEVGPKKNYADPLLWDNDLNCLIASSDGQIFQYY